MGQQASAPSLPGPRGTSGSTAIGKTGPGSVDSSPTLDLSNRDFSDTKLVQFAKENDLRKYHSLQQLTMTNCQLKNIEFVATWAATLTDLDLSRNLVSSLDSPNEMVFFLKQLIKLNLSYNYIQAMPMLFFNLVSLQTLNLSNNNITLVCKELSYLDALTDLDLSCNQISALPEEIGNTKALTKLKLNQNQIKTLPNSLGQLQKLVILVLTDNAIQKLPDQISGMATLKKLYIDNNELLDVPNTVGLMTALRELNLTNNQLIDLPASMAKLTDLSMLDVGENLFEDPRFSNQNLDELRSFLQNKPKPVQRVKYKKKTGRDTIRVIPDKKPNYQTLQTLVSAPASPQQPRKPRKLPLFRFKLVQNSYVIVDRVPTRLNSLSQGDTFLLDHTDKDTIFIWVGDNSAPKEKAKALHIAQSVNENMGGIATITVLEGKAKKDWNQANAFWSAFDVMEADFKGLDKKIRLAKDENDDLELEHRVLESRLWKFSENEEDKSSISIVGDSEPLVRGLLDSTSAFVLDSYENPNVYVWVGHYASESSRSWALLKAEELVDRFDESDPDAFKRHMVWCIDGAELWDFREMFFDWMDDGWDPEKREKIQEEKRKAEEAYLQMLEEEKAKPLLPSASASSIGSETPDDSDSSDEEREEDRDLQNYVNQVNSAKEAKLTAMEIAEKKAEDEAKLAQAAEEAAATAKLAEAQAKAQEAEQARRKKEMDDAAAAKRQSDLQAVKAEEEAKRQSLIDRLNSLSQPNLSPLMPQTISKQVQYLDLSEKVQAKALKDIDAATTSSPRSTTESSTESSKERKRRKLEPTLSAFIGVEPKDTQLLSGPKRIAAPSRRKATKNPVRHRAEIDAATEFQDTSDEAVAQKAVDKAKAGIAAGGVGLGSALVNEAQRMFQKRRAEADGAATVTTSDGKASDDINYKKGMPRLIHIKGRRKILVKQVEVHSSSLNEGDVFVLDSGKMVIFQWNGAKANRIEKGKAMDLCKNLKDKEMNGNGKVVVLEQGGNDQSDQAKLFWEILGGKPSSITSETDGGEDNQIEDQLKLFTNLYKIVEIDSGSPAPSSKSGKKGSSASVEVQPELVAKYPIPKESLDDAFCYILDCICELYVWCGNKSKMQVRKQAIKIVEGLRANRDLWCAPIARELPGGESVLFREKFSNWGYGPPIQMKQIAVGKNVAKVASSDRIDAQEIFNKKVERQEIAIDEGTGKRRVWRIVDFKKVAVEEADYGQFFSGDSYLILYTYMRGNKEVHMIYYWQGRDSSTNEKGASALLTIELGEAVSKGNTKEIRVVMNQEPKHFLSLFKGKYVIHLGKADEKPASVAVYQTHGVSAPYTKCIQVEAIPSAFSSNSVFVCTSGDKTFIWEGKHAAQHEISYAATVEPCISTRYKHSKKPVPAATPIHEGKEPSEFWKALGLSKPATFPLCHIRRNHPLRLFNSSETTGQHKVYELPLPFAHEDFTRHDCFILDAYSHLFVWRNQVSPSDLRKAMEFAVDYVEKATDGRKKDAPVYLIKAKEEPLAFAVHFQAWHPLPKADTELSQLTEARSELAKFDMKYSFDDLVNKRYPPGLDTTKLETYLKDEEFEGVFGVDRDAFNKMPVWKQQKEKRDKGLF